MCNITQILPHIVNLLGKAELNFSTCEIEMICPPCCSHGMIFNQYYFYRKARKIMRKSLNSWMARSGNETYVCFSKHKEIYYDTEGQDTHVITAHT